MLGEEPVRNEAADRSSRPVTDSLRRAGLNKAEADDIQADLSNKDFSKAEAKLIGRIGQGSRPQGLLEVLGGIFFLDSDYLRAAVAYKKAENYGVLSENARFTLVMSYIELKQLKWARDELTQLSNEKPERPLYHYWLGRLDYQDQKFADGIVRFGKAIQIDDHFIRAYDGRGLCDEAIGNLGSAEQSYRRANILNREQGSHYAWPSVNYGAMLVNLGRYAEATTLLHEALAIDPSLSKAHYELGRVDEQSSRPEAAIQNFAAAAKLDPSDPSPVYALFRLYKKAGQKELAAAMIARFRVLKAEPNAVR